MKADTIVTMLSDPNIDPTSWVGEALVEWVAKNLTRCLNDPFAREYLFKGMDVNDLSTMTTEVIKIYNESQDPTIIKKYVDGCNSAQAAESSGYGGKWAINSVGRELNEIIDANIIDYVINLQMPKGDENWPREIISKMKDYHVGPLLRNRLLNWGGTGITGIIDLVSPDKIFKVFTEDMWGKQLCRARNDSWPENVQDVLHHVMLSLPKEDASKWMQWIQTTKAAEIWEAAPDLISKKRSGEPILFGETVCRCGVITKSKSGFALHRKKCKHRESPNLYALSRVFLKEGCPSLIMCDKCGKTCKSQPGLALHGKKCKSTLGSIFREARCGITYKRQMKAEKADADTTEN